MPRGWIGAVSIGLGRALSAITPRRRRLGFVVVGTALAAWSPAPALAAAPGNDNYLASINIRGPHGRAARQYEPAPFPTGEATVQVDLFNPDREGLPFGGGPPEDQACEGTSYGKTVWYDVHPDQPGVFSIETSGYDAVIRLYEFDPATARITRTVGCFNTSAGPAESASFGEVERGDHYTIQVGGVVVGGAAASGVLDFNFRYFADRDGDGVVQELDDCPTVAGTRGGCPPELDTTPRFLARPTSGGVRVRELEVPGVPAGGVVEVRCRRCDVRRLRARAPRRGGTVRLRRFAGRALPAGASLEIFVTRPAGGTGTYRFGAVGDYTRYPIRRGTVARRVDRCLAPGSMKPRACR